MIGAEFQRKKQAEWANIIGLSGPKRTREYEDAADYAGRNLWKLSDAKIKEAITSTEPKTLIVGAEYFHGGYTDNFDNRELSFFLTPDLELAKEFSYNGEYHVFRVKKPCTVYRWPSKNLKDAWGNDPAGEEFDLDDLLELYGDDERTLQRTKNEWAAHKKIGMLGIAGIWGEGRENEIMLTNQAYDCIEFVRTVTFS